MLVVKNVSKRFKEHYAVHNVSFTLEKGYCTALIGPNGAGKTTTLRMLTGLLKQSEGTISYTNEEKDFRHLIGYLPQYPQFYNWMTGKEFLIYCSKLYRYSKIDAIKRANDLLASVGLLEAKNKRISTYSGGMKQRLGIAQALIHNPEILFLDEPVASLDPIGRREILILLERLKEKMTILFSTHILNDADEVSDSVIVLKNGTVVEKGTMNQLQQKYTTSKIELQFVKVPETLQSKLSQLPSVNSINIEKNIVHLFVTSIEEARNDLLQLITSENWELQKFQIGSLTLEEMFMKAVEK